MNREEAIRIAQGLITDFKCESETMVEFCNVVIQVLQQEPCEDCISRQAVDDAIYDYSRSCDVDYAQIMEFIDKLPPVTSQPKTGHCKECKHFEYDSVAKVDGIPLIVAHEICKKWGDGCKTREDGYCFLFEPQKGGDKE